MTRWIDEPWAKKPDVLIDTLESLYRKAIRLGKVTSPAQTACTKVMAHRGWCPAVPQDHLLAAVQDLELIYVPSGVAPGPGFVFPIRDVSQEIKRLQIRINDPEAYGARYLSIMEKGAFIGPAWLGTDDNTLATIIQTGHVLIVEGPFDLLAVRTLAPEVPALCPLTKRLGRLHVIYLTMLGVDSIHLMWDEDRAGMEATRITTRKLKDQFAVYPVECPGADPAECMCSNRSLRDLRGVLQSLATSQSVPWDDIE